jgi:uncharacterized protein (DUF779 family)
MTDTRLTASPAAITLIHSLIERHGPLMFHLSGGCCDGSAPMCFTTDMFRLGGGDVLLGRVEGVPFYTSADHPLCRSDDRIELDAVPGRGGSFSLEAPDGVRFLARTLPKG